MLSEVPSEPSPQGLWDTQDQKLAQGTEWRHWASRQLYRSLCSELCLFRSTSQPSRGGETKRRGGGGGQGDREA